MLSKNLLKIRNSKIYEKASTVAGAGRVRIRAPCVFRFGEGSGGEDSAAAVFGGFLLAFSWYV